LNVWKNVVMFYRDCVIQSSVIDNFGNAFAEEVIGGDFPVEMKASGCRRDAERPEQELGRAVKKAVANKPQALDIL
jgi:hypothetical protein